MALFPSWVLAGDEFDDRFRLAAAAPKWVRFETEGPVEDDVLEVAVDRYSVESLEGLSRELGLQQPLCSSGTNASSVQGGGHSIVANATVAT